jgi:hypothetical protein
MTIFEKARCAGLDAFSVEKAQWRMDTVLNRQLEIHACHDQVLLHAAMYDNPDASVVIPRLGVGCVRPGAIAHGRDRMNRSPHPRTRSHRETLAAPPRR